VTIRHLGGVPWTHLDAYVTPTAVLAGQVSTGVGSCILHGAVRPAEAAGPGRRERCDHGERGAARHRATPPAHRRPGAGRHANPQLTGVGTCDEMFLAVGAMALNGGHLGRAPAAKVGLGGWPTSARSWRRGRPDPGWVGGGRRPGPDLPARRGGAIGAGLAEARWSFLHYVLGADDAGGRRGRLQAARSRTTSPRWPATTAKTRSSAPPAAGDGAAPAPAHSHRGF
jgi:hypothetical protein